MPALGMSLYVGQNRSQNTGFYLWMAPKVIVESEILVEYDCNEFIAFLACS